jgi:hypothetical protein
MLQKFTKTDTTVQWWRPFKNNAASPKRLISRVNILFFVMLFLSNMNGFAQFSGGNGNQGTPYLISSKADMETLANNVDVGNNYAGKYFLLTQDLNLFNTITAMIKGIFSGNFDGGGYNITMSINSNYHAGLFYGISGANIQNLSISGNITTSWGNASGICVTASNSTITNCSNEAVISVNNYNSCAGGICVTVDNCNIVNCINMENISTIDPNPNYIYNFYNRSGGICVEASNNSIINNCYNMGNIVAIASIPRSGGICAIASNCTISNCYNVGNASATSGSTGNSAYAGGICAQASNSSIITNCYNLGNMTSSSGYRPHAGGICGYGSNIKIENCFAANTKVSSVYMGRILGGGTGSSIANNYALSSMLLNNYYAFTENTASEKNGQDTDISSFQSQIWIMQNLGWNFATIWKQRPTQFPVLYYYKYPPVITFSIPIVTYGDQITLNATSDNTSVPIAYETSDNTIAEISGNTLIARKTGSVVITARQEASNDYSAGVANVNLTIQKKTITITANAANMIYGDTPPAYTCRYSGFVNGENERVLLRQPTLICNVTAQSNAGNYDIVPVSAEAQNYSFNYVNGTLTIQKRLLQVTPNNASRLYGSNNPVFTLSYNGFVNSETSSVLTFPPAISCSANSTSNVGSYPIIPSGAEAQNYSFNYQNGMLTITKAPLTITAEDKTRKQKQPNPEFTLAYSGFKNNETTSVLDILPTILCEADETSPAGGYDIVLFGGSDNNYQYTLVNGRLEVSATTGINNVLASKLQISPNPVKNEIFIKSDLQIEKIEIHSLTGSLLLSDNNFNEKKSVSTLSKGIYLLKIYTDKGVTVSKIVKE